MNPPDPTDALREAIAYVRGMEAATHLTPEQRSQQAIHKMTAVLSGLADAIDALRQRQDALEASLQRVNGKAPAQTSVEGGSEPCAAPSRPVSQRLCCPSCQKELPIVRELWESDAFEVFCPYCALTVEVR